MKNKLILMLIAGMVYSSCTRDLLNQLPQSEIPMVNFWKTVDDAVSSANGVYAAMRDYFGVDFKYDSNTDICHGSAYGNETGSPDGMSSAWSGCHTIINRANETLYRMNSELLPRLTAQSDKELYERVEGEVKFLRAMAYFRLMDLFVSVPYIDKPMLHDEVITLSQMPVQELYRKIMDDLDAAAGILPTTYESSDYGRPTYWTALAFRGKVNLFWASWMKFGRPEWSAVAGNARDYYDLARQDFSNIITNSDYKLFRDGDPGEFSNPNYRQLFSLENETCEEILFSAIYTGPNMGLGSEMKAMFSPRQGGNNGGPTPTVKLIPMYLKLDGTPAPEMVLSKEASTVNGACNPATYEGRDWRMKASILWDQEMVLLQNADGTQFARDSAMFKWGTPGTGSLDDPYYNYYNMKTGYGFRKWMPTYLGYSRYDCPQDFYLMRYADVLLMYCECVNEIEDGANEELEGHINAIRRRGNMTPSNTIRDMTRDEFFALLVNERAVEFLAEGQRYFDIRRWRMAEEIWLNGTGYVLNDTHGTKVQDEFRNVSRQMFERFYTAQIPTAEISRNPNLVQNSPWL